MSFSAKAGKVALQALAMAGNMAAMFLVSKSVSAAVSWINSYVNAASKAKEASQALTQEMKKFNADIGKSAKTISSLDSRYQELSGHMNRLGENVSASTSQYEEYKEIISQISSIMPELSVRFNSQGEAIGFTEGKLKDLTKTYEEYRKKAARDFLAKGDGNGNTVDDIVAHYNNQTTAKWYDDLWNRLATKGGLVNYMSGMNMPAGKLLEKAGGANNPLYKGITSFFGADASLEDLLNQSGLSSRKKAEIYKWLQELSKDDFDSITQFTNILGYDVTEISGYDENRFQEFRRILASKADSYALDIEAAADGMKEIIIKKLQADDDYYSKDLPDAARDRIMSVVSGLDDELLQELDINSEVRAGEFAQLLITGFSSDEEFSRAFDELYDENLSGLPINEYAQKVHGLIDTIGKAMGLEKNEQQNKLLIKLGFEDVDILKGNYNTVLNRAAEKFSGKSHRPFGDNSLFNAERKALSKFAEENSINTQDEIAFWNRCIEESETRQEAMQKYAAGISNAALFSAFTDTELGARLQHITGLFNQGALSHRDYFKALQTEINSFDASAFTDSVEDMNHAAARFFTDSVRQTADGLSTLINSFDNGEMSVSEYLEGYLAIGDTLSTLTDNLQENSAAWNKQGKAISEAGNTVLDDTQNSLNSAMSVIESYQDSIYSLEQIMNDTVAADSEEFTAHADVIAEDLYRIIQTGGEMADAIASTLGATTGEIAQSLTENVSNQEIACQAIMANTNNAISDMSSSIGELFDTLGQAISDFKVDLSFGVKSIVWKKVDVLGKELSLPEIQFELGASGDSLEQIGSAVSSFGKSIASNYAPQKIELEDFHFGSTDAAKDRKYIPSAGTTQNYETSLDRIRDAAKSAGDTAKGYIDAYMAYMEKSLDAGETDYRTYSNEVSSFLKGMFEGGRLPAKEYFDYTGQMLEKQKGIYDRALSAVSRRYDKEIDRINTLMDAVKAQNDLLEKQKDDYDSVLSVVDRVYQNEIDRINKQKDAIQDKIDALNDEADAYDLIRRKEEAQYRLQRSLNQRTDKLYAGPGTGYIYGADRQAVLEAQETLKDMEREEQVNRLQKEQEDLDASITLLEEYRNKWAQIPDEHKRIANEQLAAQIWGADYEQLILSSRISDLESFKDNYLAIQTRLDDNTALIASYEEKISYYEQLKQQWAQISGAYQESVEDQYAAMLLGQSWEADILNGRLETMNSFREEYIRIQQSITDAAWASSNEQVRAQKEAQKGADGNISAAGKLNTVSPTPDAGTANTGSSYSHTKPAAAVLGATAGITAGTASMAATRPSSNIPPSAAHAKPTMAAGIAAGASSSGFPKTALDKTNLLKSLLGGSPAPAGLLSGLPKYHTGLEKGFVGNAAGNKSLEILQRAGINPEEVPAVLQKGELVLTPFQTENIADRLKLLETINLTPDITLPDYSILNKALHASQSSQTVEQHNVFNVTLPNVTNNSSAERLVNELQHLSLDAYQYFNKR